MGMLRWGILGTGRINYAFVPAVQKTRGHQCYAVASRSFETARRFSKKWGIPNFYGSYEELLRDPKVDAVYLPLPNHLHSVWAIQALKAGKHVLSEKPLACSPDEIQKMFRQAKKSQRILMEGFMYRYHPAVEKMIQLARRGKVGEIRVIRTAFTIPAPDDDNVRWMPSFGGGATWDLGCYCVHLSRVLAGEEPCELKAVYEKDKTTGVDLFLSAVMKFPAGPLALFDCGMSGSLRKEAEVIGTKGVLRLLSPWAPDRVPHALFFQVHDRPPVKIPYRKGWPFQMQIRRMADCIAGRKKPLITREDSLKNCGVLEGLLECAKGFSSVSS